MRSTARRATTPGPTATAVPGPLAASGLAAPHAAPAPLYAPSAPVQATDHGANTAAPTPERAVTPTCAPRPRLSCERTFSHECVKGAATSVLTF
ncbi:hypothetical protein ABZ354_25530 [Streptomyces sp. NPDC005925]|uniref:hypothetical protein n=1 Tax=Streptomyces sp. NPDC005925 TaxID=3157172 RepID=UPI0033E78B7F